MTASRRRGRRRRDEGFNLAELLLAMALWASAFLSIFALYSTCRGAVVRSNNLIGATFLAQSEIESLKFTNFDNVNNDSTEHTYVAQSIFNGVPVATTFIYTITVTSPDTPSVKNILVEVVWQERGFNGTDRATWQSIKMESRIVK